MKYAGLPAAAVLALAFVAHGGITAETAWEDVPPQTTVKTVVEMFSPHADLAPSTNYTDLATNALADSFAAGFVAATNYTDSATNALAGSFAAAYMPLSGAYTKSETDAKIVELAPAPGDYETVSSRAMSAIQTEADPTVPSWAKVETPPYLTSLAPAMNYTDSATNALIRLQPDRTGIPGAVIIGHMPSNCIPGTASCMIGTNNASPGDFSFAAGGGCVTTGDCSIALGFNAFNTNRHAFVWSGWTTQGRDNHDSDESYNMYNIIKPLPGVNPYYSYGLRSGHSHGDGTFNIDPFGGIDGFWIGETNLTGHISSAILSATNGLVPFARDRNGNLTAITIGYRKNATFVGRGSIAAADGATATETYSVALGYNPVASGNYAFAHGVGVQATKVGAEAAGQNSLATNNYSYVWSQGMQYGSHGDGSFNIFPSGLIDGFWIGHKTLRQHIQENGGGGGNRTIAMFILPLNSTNETYMGVELKASTNNFTSTEYFCHTTWPEWDEADSARIYAENLDTSDRRKYVKVTSARQIEGAAAIVMLVTPDDCRRMGGAWLSEGNEEIVWTYSRITEGDREEIPGTGKAMWRPCAPVRWFSALPAWAATN